MANRAARTAAAMAGGVQVCIQVWDRLPAPAQTPRVLATIFASPLGVTVKATR